jgi:hypothetical protein
MRVGGYPRGSKFACLDRVEACSDDGSSQASNCSLTSTAWGCHFSVMQMWKSEEHGGTHGHVWTDQAHYQGDHLLTHGMPSHSSAYNMCNQFRGSGINLASPAPSVNNPVWSSLWKLAIPRKVQIFCWRALHGIVPLKSILANRHVGTDGQCPICRQGPEDVKHLIFTCSRSMELWRALGLSHVILEVLEVDRSGSVVLEQILRQPNQPL